MAISGWESYQAIEPYLQKPTIDHIISEMTEADML